MNSGFQYKCLHCKKVLADSEAVCRCIPVAGRELDALVAEHVMGWTGITHQPACEWSEETWEEWTGLPPLKKDVGEKRYLLHPH